MILSNQLFQYQHDTITMQEKIECKDIMQYSNFKKMFYIIKSIWILLENELPLRREFID